MVTKIKPRRIKSDNSGSLGDFLGYQDESKFLWGQGGSGQGNVKAFYLSSDSDLTTAQAAIDRYRLGKTPIVIVDDRTYYPTRVQTSATLTNVLEFFQDVFIPTMDGTTWIKQEGLAITYQKSDGVVTQIQISGGYKVSSYLGTEATDGLVSVFTPVNDGHPATKKYVDDNIAELMGLGKFLSLWNASTGQPISFPYTTPYAYSTGDYFLVETISSATPPVNYRPDGSSYTGTASSTAETDELEVGDVYIYDGSVWLLQSNHGKTVTFANIAGQPTDNTNLATALGNKQDKLISGTNIKTINSQSITGSGNFDVINPIEETDYSGITPQNGTLYIGWEE